MSQRVQYGDAGAILEFPDELSRDEIASILKAKGPELNERFSKTRIPASEPVRDEFGVGEEIRGIGRAFFRGGHRAVQQADIAGIRSVTDYQDQLDKALDGLNKFDADFGTLPKGDPRLRWRQDQLGKIGLLENELRIRKGMAPELAESFVKHQKAIEALPPTKAEEEFRKPESSPLSFFRNPVELALSATAESLPAMLPAIAGAVGGPAGIAAGAGVGSFGAESAARVTAAMQADKVDTKNPQAVLAWFGDRAKSDRAGAKADLAALGPAAFDALTGGLAGRFLAPAIGQGVKKIAGATAKEIGLQMAGGGAGSIAGSTIAGEPIDWKDVILEVAAEIAPGEAVSNVLAERGNRPAVIKRTQEEPSAITVQSSATLPLRETPADRQTMGPGVPLAGEPSRAPAPQEEEIVQAQPDVAPVVFNSVLSVPGLTPVVYYDPITPIQTSDKGTYEAGRVVTENILTKSGFTIPPEERAKAEAEIARQGVERTASATPAPPTAPTPAVAATPTAAASEERPDPLDVAADFLEMVNFSSRDPAYVGAPFKENLPTDLVSLGDTLVKGGKVEGRTETLRFAFVRDNDSGEIHLLPAWKNARQTIMLRLPGQAAGKGTNLGSFIGRKAADATSPKFTVLASVLLKQPAHSFPTTFTQDEYDAIRDQARTQAGEIVASEQALHRVAPTADTIASESEAPADASGVTPDLMRRIFDAMQATPTDARQLRTLFEELNSQTDWSASTVWNQLKKADIPNATFDQFHQTFDPIGYAPAPGVAGGLPEVPAVLGQPAGAEQTAQTPAQAAFDPVAELTAIFGGQLPQRIQVVNDANLPWDGLYVGGTIALNTARLATPEELRRVLREELVHSVASDPKVAKEFKRLFDAVTDEDLKAAFGEGYSPDTAREEAVIDYIERLPEDDGIWKRLWQSVRDAISKAWGIRTLAELFGADFTDSDARAVTAYAYRRILRESNENSKDDPARFSLASYVFRNEQQKRELIERAQKAGVDPSGIAEAEQMAGIQAGLIPAQFVSEATNLVSAAPKTVERATGELLRPILDIGNISISPQSIAAMPRSTDEQVRASELAAGTVLSKHLFIKDQTVDFTRQVAEANGELTKAMALLSEAQIKESEAAFASAMTDTLIEKYDAYLGDTRSLATQSGNVNLELDTLLDKSVQQLTEMRPQHSSISKALAILAENVPGGLTTSADVVQWAISSNVLVGKVGQSTIQFLLHGKTLPGIQTVLIPPLAKYDDLPVALLKMKNVMANKRAVQQDITAFKTWFAGVRKPSEVGPLKFAREYYKLRRQKELAADVASRINKDIDRADARVRSLVEASDFVERMTVDPQYLESVRIASSYSNAIVQKLASIDPITRQIKWAGPLGGNYVFDFSPDTLSSVESMNQVQQLIAEIDAFSGDPKSDPLLVKSWQNQKEYLNLSLVSSAATPQAGSVVGGFAAGRGQLVLDIYDWINLAAARKLVSSQNVLNRIATKASNHASLAFQATDAFLEPLRQVNENKDYGVKAIANKFVDAMTAHKFIPKDTRQRYKYEFLILEPIIASLQNNLSRHYHIGDKVDGHYTVMKEDMALIDAMKKYTAEIQRFANPPGTTGSPALRFNPSQIEREIGEVTYSTKQLGTGPSVMPRLSSQWGSEFTREWLKNPDPARRLNLLRDDLNFRGAVLRRIHDANTAEYTATSKLQEYYDDIDQGLWAGTVTLDTFDALVDHIATAKQASEPATTVQEQRDIVKAIILEDVTSDVTSFSDKFLNAPRDEKQLKTIPESLRHILTGRNSFTSPRGKLVAPSSYYAYSVASDPRKAQFIASARLLFELRQLEALDNLRVVLEDSLAKMEKPVSEASGVVGRFKAKRSARLRSVKEAREGDSQVTYQELKLHVAKLRTLFNEQERLLQREYQEPDHVAWGFAHGLTGYHASMLLGKPQPAVTNFIGGVLLAPSLIRARQGQVLRSMATLGTTPFHLAELAVSRVALMLRNRPALAGVWNKNKAQWGIIARTIADMADYYSNISNHALATGAVAPYDLRGRQKLLWKLRNTGGRLEFNEPSLSMNALNQIGTIPGLSQAVSWWKSINPRWVDQMVNLLNTQEALLMLDQLKGYGFQAWQVHESTYGPDWKNLADAKNLLTPQELGSGTAKGASFTRQLFNASGSIDKILLDFYERTKGMTPEQRAAAPLFEDEGAQNAFLLEYLKMTNLPTQSNRPPAFRGGIARPLVTLFMGYPAALGEQISELFRTHTKDAGAGARITSIAIPFILLAMVILYGMMSREAGQELTEAWTGKASSQLRLANVLSDSASSEDAARYAIVSVANLIPFFGDAANRMIGGVASKPVLDLTALIPVATMVNDIGNTIFKAGQSRDPIYPLADFGKRWFPPLEPVLNRIPMFEGDLAQRNVQAALRAVAPGDMEVKQGFGSSVPRLTPTSPIIRDLVAAAYLGDTETVRAKYAEAVAEKARQGVPEPERAVWATLQSQLPSRKVFGRLPTAGEESRLLSRMTDSQRGTYDRSKSAFGLISEAVGGGKEIAFTDQSEPAVIRRPRLSSLGRSGLGRRGRTRSLSGRSIRQRRLGSHMGRRRRGTRRRVGFGSRRRSLVT